MTFYQFIKVVKLEAGTEQLTQEQAAMLMKTYYLWGKTTEDDIVRAAKDVKGGKK